MGEIRHPNIGHVLQICQQYVYTDEEAAKIADLIYENTASTDEFDRNVLAYLRENKPYAPDWDDLAVRLKSPDVYTEKALDLLTAQAQECLRLRVLDGCSIVEIAAACTLPENEVQIVLKEARDNFWEMFVPSELDTLQTCRKFVYSDTVATDTAIMICSKGYDIYAPDELDMDVFVYLATNMPYALNWDSIAVHLAASDTHAQKAFDTLDARAQQCLRLRTLDGCSITEIAATCKLTEKKVQSALKMARNNFWEAFVASEAQTLRTCRKFIYSDTDATDTAVAVCSKNWEIPSSEASSADALAYLGADKLSWENWDILAIHLRGLDDGTLDPDVQKALDTLEESEIELLRLRVGDGDTIESIAKKLDCTEAEVETSLTAYRKKFWDAFTDADPVVLRECRRLIHDDTDAEEIAIAICMQEVPVENVRQHVYNYLVKRWDPIPDWDNPKFIKVVKAVIHSIDEKIAGFNAAKTAQDLLKYKVDKAEISATDEKIAGFNAAKTAYMQLEYSEQDLLKYKVVEHLSDEEIAQVLMMHLEQVERDVILAKTTFWKLFTRERWSTLSYFIEELFKEDGSPSTEIFKVEAEQSAAETAHESLDQIDKEILESRYVHGHSVKEIADRKRTSSIEIAEILTRTREEFYEEFLGEIYRLWIPDVSEIITDKSKADKPKTQKITVGKIIADEDDVGNAWEKLQEQYYKIVPANLRGWLTTSAERSKLGTLKEKIRHRRLTEKHGSIHINSEGEPVPLISITENPLTPDEALIKKEAEEQELASWEAERNRWFHLLNKTTSAILKSNKPEKKLFLLINYFLQPKLNELKKANGRSAPEFQHQGEAMAMAHITNRRQLRVTQAWIGEPIDETDRTIRRYAAEIIRLVKKCAAEIGISRAELVAGCTRIKALDAEKK